VPACEPRRCSALLLVSLLASLAACSHNVVWRGETHEPIAAPEPPLPMVVGVVVRSFEAERVAERGLVERFARQLEQKQLFQGVLFPVPADHTPRWELQLLVRDSAAEPESNFWKAAIGSVLVPAAWFITLRSEYELELQALLVQHGRVVGTYDATGELTYEFGLYANRQAMDIEGIEVMVSRVTGRVISDLAADADAIARENTALR